MNRITETVSSFSLVQNGDLRCRPQRNDLSSELFGNSLCPLGLTRRHEAAHVAGRTFPVSCKVVTKWKWMLSYKIRQHLPHYILTLRGHQSCSALSHRFRDACLGNPSRILTVLLLDVSSYVLWIGLREIKRTQRVWNDVHEVSPFGGTHPKQQNLNCTVCSVLHREQLNLFMSAKFIKRNWDILEFKLSLIWSFNIKLTPSRYSYIKSNRKVAT